MNRPSERARPSERRIPYACLDYRFESHSGTNRFHLDEIMSSCDTDKVLLIIRSCRAIPGTLVSPGIILSNVSDFPHL
jgi:hypothetical protein